MTDFADKFIAFVDVLGFKKLVEDAENGVGMPLPELLKLLECLGTGTERERFEEHGPFVCPRAPYIQRHLDFQVTQTSDCVVVSAELSPAGVVNLLAHCWTAVMGLLQRGIMCRGYVKRGRIYHTATQVVGTGYQATLLAEKNVTAFKREADERGTPFVEIDPAVSAYIDGQSDACVKEMFSRFVKRDGDVVALFPFQRLSHSFVVAGLGREFAAAKERHSNQNLRALIQNLKERVWSFVDRNNKSATQKAAHYVAALEEQLAVCDRTDEVINMLDSPYWRRPKP